MHKLDLTAFEGVVDGITVLVERSFSMVDALCLKRSILSKALGVLFVPPFVVDAFITVEESCWDDVFVSLILPIFKKFLLPT